ncbi:MAG: hypothetical protein RIC30_15205 [Marinoscillum sp.]|uniref:hypothetical protein n=1 Tax=Marinoscillum sp. TaxID=2024838 RepID=UPI0032F361D8
MTLLRVHDHQQDLTNEFVKIAQKTIKKGTSNKQQLFLMGQEMGFCNDEIRVLLEDAVSSEVSL